MNDRLKKLVETRVSTRQTARLIMSILAVLFTSFFFLPWQQTTFGMGRVIAYAQQERQQYIDAPIKGRVVEWFVREGQSVKKGDKILDIADNDPQYMDRMITQRSAISERLSAISDKASSIDYEIESLKASKLSVEAAYESKIHSAEQKIAVAEQSVLSSKAAMDVAEVNLKRQKTLFEEGLTSRRYYELTQLKFTKMQIEYEKDQKKLIAEEANVRQLKSELAKELNIIDAKINASKAKKASARSDLTKAKETLPKIEASIARQAAQVVYAPKDGTIMRLIVQEGSGQVKAGDHLAILVPNAASRAVELWIDGNDIPLVHPDQEVRLQFQGYPALQLSGWPELALGTFSGVVQFVDVTDNNSGKFRVLVIPNEENYSWPDSRYLRQGVRTKGWIFLNRVSIAFELWRKFNNFPPALPGTGDEVKLKVKKK